MTKQFEQTGVIGCFYVLAGVFSACRKPREVVLMESTADSSTYAIQIEPDTPSSNAEGSTHATPALPSYTKTDPYKH